MQHVQHMLFKQFSTHSKSFSVVYFGDVFDILGIVLYYAILCCLSTPCPHLNVTQRLDWRKHSEGQIEKNRMFIFKNPFSFTFT